MRPLTVLATLAALSTISHARPADAAGPALVEHARDADTVVIRFTEEFGEIADSDQPWLEVFGDGRVVRHLPSYMRGAGTHTSNLGAAKLEALLVPLADAVVGFDAAAVTAAKSAVEDSLRDTDQELHYVSEASWITIEITLVRYLAGDAGAEELRDVRRQVRYYSIRDDAERYADVAAIRRLGDAHGLLHALLRGEVSR